MSQIENHLSEHQSSIIGSWGLRRSEREGIYRFMNNENISVEELIVREEERTSHGFSGGHALVLQDTVELSYSGLWGKLRTSDEDIGPLSHKQTAGFFVHPCLALDAESVIPIGLSSIDIWNRAYEPKGKKKPNVNSQAIEEKESYTWLKSAQRTKEILFGADQITIVGDRASDIFEVFSRVPDETTSLVIRVNQDRNLASGGKLYASLNSEKIQGTKEVEIKGNEKRRGRHAKLQIRWKTVKIFKPNCSVRHRKQDPDELELTVVEVVESSQTVPPGESPIHWRLWTSLKIETLTEALQIVEWYKQRWWIEDFFRLLKTQGFRIESAQFGTGAALKKLAVLTMGAAISVLAMRQGRENEKLSANLQFDEGEQVLLTALQTTVEGKTKAQKNPYRLGSLAWAIWIIARLGGWTMAKNRPPGVIVLRRGLRKFRQQYQVWLMAMQLINKMKPPT